MKSGIAFSSFDVFYVITIFLMFNTCSFGYESHCEVKRKIYFLMRLLKDYYPVEY